MLQKILPFLVAVILLSSCSTTQSTTSSAASASMLYNDYQIGKDATKKDAAVEQMLQPYTVSLNATMNKVIGFSNNGLISKQPESGLGNFMADCMRIMGEKKFGKKVDAGFMNQFGIRSNISKGNITTGKVFELMPFDNVIVLQEIKGPVLQEFLNKIAADGGWPVSGIKMGIRDKKAVEVLVNGQPLDMNATYTIANSDYVANGGDNCDMLRKVPKKSIGYLYRDALIEYIGQFTQQGKPVDKDIENRVSHVN